MADNTLKPAGERTGGKSHDYDMSSCITSRFRRRSQVQRTRLQSQQSGIKNMRPVVTRLTFATSPHFQGGRSQQASECFSNVSIHSIPPDLIVQRNAARCLKESRWQYSRRSTVPITQYAPLCQPSCIAAASEPT